jgi:hypothetical protein
MIDSSTADQVGAAKIETKGTKAGTGEKHYCSSQKFSWNTIPSW